MDIASAVLVRIRGIDTLMVACCGPDGRFPGGTMVADVEPNPVCGMRFPGGDVTCELRPHFSWLDHAGSARSGTRIVW